MEEAAAAASRSDRGTLFLCSWEGPHWVAQNVARHLPSMDTPRFPVPHVLELGSQMSSRGWPRSDPDHVTREGAVTLGSTSFICPLKPFGPL